MAITKPASGSTGWDTNVNAVIDAVNGLAKVASTGAYSDVTGRPPSNPQPAWNNTLGWTYDPLLISATTNPTSGVIYLSMIYLRAGTVTNLLVDIGTAIATPTASANYAGLYDLTGARVAVTADQASNWATTGVRTCPFTSTYTVTTDGFFYAAILANATTTPAFQRASSAGHPNNNLANGTLRSCSYLTGQTSLPATATLASTAATNNSLWSAVT